eukprot:SAG31_NODE_37728_length_302_cov_0.413793_1_plen_60_part_01
MLQSAVISECHRNCDSCDVNTVRIIIGGCLLANGLPAKDQMCTHVNLPGTDDGLTNLILG